MNDETGWLAVAGATMKIITKNTENAMRIEETREFIAATLSLAGDLLPALRPAAGTPAPRAEAGGVMKTNDNREKQP